CAPGSFVGQCPVGDVLGGCGGGRVPHVLGPGRSLPTVLGICGVRVGALPDLRGVPAPVGGGALRPYAGRRRDGRSAGTGSGYCDGAGAYGGECRRHSGGGASSGGGRPSAGPSCGRQSEVLGGAVV